jgi:nucleoside-diphosphate-sugar epimerase
MSIYNLLIEDAEVICNNINFDELDNKTIIITGSTGLVGLRFVATIYYLNEFCGKNILLYASSMNQLSDEFECIFKQKNIFHIHGDITGRIMNFLPNADYIIHASGYGQPTKFLVDGLKTIELNTVVTDKLLQKLNIDGKFLFVSTSEIYSGSTHIPYSEEDIGTTNTNHPRACYIEGKRLGETICSIYRQNGIDVKSARLCLAYGGSSLNDSRVMNSIVIKGLNGKIELLDSGEAIRTYCYVIDAAIMMWNILLNGKSDIYNVAGNSRISIKDLAIMVGEKLSVDVIIPENQQKLIGSPNDVWLNISKYEKEFGKMSFINLYNGIEKMIDWYKEMLV